MQRRKPSAIERNPKQARESRPRRIHLNTSGGLTRFASAYQTIYRTQETEMMTVASVKVQQKLEGTVRRADQSAKNGEETKYEGWVVSGSGDVDEVRVGWSGGN